MSRTREVLGVVSLAIAAALGVWDQRVVGLALLAALAAATWRFPDRTVQMAAWTVLILRPALDAFTAPRSGNLLAVSPAMAYGVGLVVVTAVLVLRRGRDGRPVWPDAELRAAHYWLFAAYGIGVVAGVRWYGSEGVMTGGRELIRMGDVVAALLVVSWWVTGNPHRYRRGWAGLFAGLLAPVGVALWQLASGQGYLETAGLNRVRGTFSHPNSFGYFLVPFILIVVAAVPGARGRGRVVRLLGATGLVGLLALTYSRTALLALGTGLAALIAIEMRRVDRRTLVRVAGTAAVVLALGGLVSRGAIRERFANLSIGRATLQAARTGASENSFSWRVVNWMGLVRLGAQHPWIGHGAGMTTVLNPLVSNENGIPFNAHNDFVRFFFETGLVGLACYLLYSVLLCRWAVRRAGRDSPAQAGAAVAAAWVALLFLTAGTPELSLQTGLLHTLNAMLALLSVSEVPAPAPAVRMPVPAR